MPMGMPGWPESACCTASMARALMAFARSRWAAVCSVIFLCAASVCSGVFRMARNMTATPYLRQCAKALGCGPDIAGIHRFERQDVDRSQALLLSFHDA